MQIQGQQQNAPLRLQRGATFDLGGMCGEHRQIGQLVQQGLHLVCPDAIFRELAQGMIEGAAPQTPAGADQRAPVQEALYLLSDMRQRENTGYRPRITLG
jgi:hypothetical protein